MAFFHNHFNVKPLSEKTMKFKRFISICLLAMMATASSSSFAGNIDATTARATANQFLKQHAASSPSFKSASLADIRLSYAETSNAKANAKAYYAFNIKGGGFIIVAGEDRANQVLGYSEQGQFDFNNLPENLKALLRGYKEEIEYLQAHPELNVSPIQRAAQGAEVKPLIKSHWGQEMPYYLQCPIYQDEYCVVGCVATAMSQVMHYWQYPKTSPELNSYYCYDIGQTIPALPETSFDYSKMLNSYCHWDWELSQLIQDTYTDQQAQAVAKLARYCGQAVHMSYSPDGSGAYVSSQLSAMKDFGYSSDAQDISRSSWWGTANYTTEEWEALVKAELDAGRPILYSANDPEAGGHAFVCDGYNAQGLLHFNFGWYGTCDGWYASTALNMTHRDGEVLHFNSSHEMLTGIVPPEYCVISTDGLSAQGDFFILGESMAIEAKNVTILTTHQQLNLFFTINAANGKIKSSSAINITPSEFEQGSDLGTTISLPATLEHGQYNVKLNYYLTSPRMPVPVNCEWATLNVVGHLAKYNAPFSIDDVTATIDYLLDGTHPGLTIDDLTELIDYILYHG